MTVLRHLRLEGFPWDTVGKVIADLRPHARRGAASAANDAGPSPLWLGRAVEGEVIPRLVAAHAAARAVPEPQRIIGNAPDDEDVAEFAKALLAEDPAAANTFVSGMIQRSVSLETICLQLMTPTARRIGDLWVADLCHFVDVTVALGRLQYLLRALSQTVSYAVTVPDHGRRALLAAVPGEQHTFGALMVAEFLRRAGWDVAGDISTTTNEVVAIVRDEWFSLVGLSASSERTVSDLVPVISAIRQTSRNAAVVVLVGGNVFLEHPDFVALVGADATAVDAQQAVLKAERQIALQPPPVAEITEV